MRNKIFINYRRRDSEPFAHRLKEALAAIVGKNRLFIDVNNIPPGDDFAETIRQTLSETAVTLVLIGDRWLEREGVAPPRVFLADDFVRNEISMALEQSPPVVVIPVLLDDTLMPKEEMLPDPLKDLTRRQAIRIGSNDFSDDFARLRTRLEELGLVSPPSGHVSRAYLAAAGALLAIATLILAAWIVLGTEKPPTDSPPSPIVDEKQAAVLYAQACERGTAQACSSLATMYLNGRGVEQSDAKAFELVDKACDLGLKNDCTRVALMYLRGRGTAQDDVKAVELLGVQCDGKDLEACGVLGILYQSGQGVSKDPARGAELLRSTCDGGAMIGCTALGEAYEKGVGLTQDGNVAIALYRKACDASEGKYGCRSLGSLYERGLFVERDTSKAIELYRQACEHRDGLGCLNLGKMYWLGTGVPKDIQLAGDAFRKGCEWGDASSCTAQAAILQGVK